MGLTFPLQSVCAVKPTGARPPKEDYMNPPGQDHHDADDDVVLTTTEARQGITSGHVRTVLAASLVLALIAFPILYYSFFG